MYSIDSLTSNLMALSEAERNTLFQLINDHADLLNKVFPELPLINHVLNNTGNEENPLIYTYNRWKNL